MVSKLHVLFELPDEIKMGLANDTMQRFGGVIRDSGTKEILFHLKETGMEYVDQGGNIAPTPEVFNQMKALGMVGKTSVVVNLLTLGVTVLGFAYIGSKLSQIREQLVSIHNDLNRIEGKVDYIDLQLEISTLSKLSSAHEMIDRATRLDRESDQRKLLQDARLLLIQIKNFFYGLASKLHEQNRVMPMFDRYSLYYESLALGLYGDIKCGLLLNDIDDAVETSEEGRKLLRNCYEYLSVSINPQNSSFFVPSEKVVHVKARRGTMNELLARSDTYPEQIRLLKRTNTSLREWSNLGNSTSTRNPFIFIKHEI